MQEFSLEVEALRAACWLMHLRLFQCTCVENEAKEMMGSDDYDHDDGVREVFS